RYPELQKRQVSCHAAHVEGERVVPCGQCEKCSRVVTMLTALGADPKQCGYTDAQVDKCLQRFIQSGLSQEDEGQQHLAYLLKARGVFQGSVAGGLPARERPEVASLRFDKDHSPMEEIPVDLRRPLYTILLKHAN